MSPVGIILGLVVLSFSGATDFAPTAVISTPPKTTPPTETQGVKYVETVYKATNHKTMSHTIEPLRPSYEVSYQTTRYSTINNQTIETQSSEFATVLNSTVLENSEMMQIYTYKGAPTYYQTLEFATQKVVYTPVTGNTSVPVTTTESNALPFV